MKLGVGVEHRYQGEHTPAADTYIHMCVCVLELKCAMEMELQLETTWRRQLQYSMQQDYQSLQLILFDF